MDIGGRMMIRHAAPHHLPQLEAPRLLGQPDDAAFAGHRRSDGRGAGARSLAREAIPDVFARHVRAAAAVDRVGRVDVTSYDAPSRSRLGLKFTVAVVDQGSRLRPWRT